MLNRLKKFALEHVEAAPLAVFRIFFGLMMFLSLVRFWANGWIEKLYLEPSFHFSYYGFEWVKPIGNYTYLLFIVCAITSLMVAIGYKYRLAILTFFLSFTYIELMDKTTYLNHYYFISVLSFLMFFLPASAYFSLDAKQKPERSFQFIPQWNIALIKVLLTMVYFYAGLAKLNSDWIIEAMPLKMWLPAKFDTPIIGPFLGNESMQYIFSWAGALFDLFIPFFLWFRKTRIFAYAFVVIFHLLTGLLFPIGMFPYIMIVSTLIFFDSQFHHRILAGISRLLRISKRTFDNGKKFIEEKSVLNRVKYPVIFLFFAVQLLFPWRYLLYPGELFWTEEGYRFSWRVMLMEKSGYAQFKIVNKDSGSWFYVDNTDFLTPFQEKQMSFQPDFILEYAHFLKTHFKEQGHENIGVYVDCYVALNGRLSRVYIDPGVDLSLEKETFRPKSWILPFNDSIKGI